ncbi:MAG: response regulator [Planctomycetes bacterium]|nr:response regulator [Planctomycetota bacterium]
MTRKRVLDVGNCDLDHATLGGMLARSFDVEVMRAHTADESLDLLREQPVDLVLVNRVLDRDETEGIDLIRRIKADPELASQPVMLVTNFPEHQEAAVREGAEFGFGKRALDAPETSRRLARFLQ